MNRHLVLMVSVLFIGALVQRAPAALLQIDVDDRERANRDMTDVGNSVTGFESFQLSGNIPATGNAPAVGTTTRTLAGYTITTTAVNAAGTAQGGIDDRDRANPTTAPTLNQLYDDFIFTASGVGLGGGLDITITGGGLAANTPYRVSVYSYDSDSTLAPQPRSADWFDGNSSNALMFSTAFSAANAPMSDDQYRFTGVAMSDGTGALFIRGRSTTGIAAQPGVIVNGIVIDVIPEPSSMALVGLAVVGAIVGRRYR